MQNRPPVGGEEVPDMLSEVADQSSAQAHAPPRVLESTVLIIGAGFAGMAAAVKLLEAGVRDIRILERAPSVGGTWRDNTYPGCACDIPSHLYSFSFFPNPDWSHHYSPQPEIRAYLERARQHFGLDRFLTPGADCISAEFDAVTARWTLTCRDGRRFRARFVIGGLGPLRIPRYPGPVDRSRFAGPQMHSATWDPAVDLAGKRVGVVGSGASAIQVVPNIADTAGHVQVFQRTPPWVSPRPDFQYPEAVKRLFRTVPALMLLLRLFIYLQHELYFLTAFSGPDFFRRFVRASMTRHIVQSMGSPEAAKALIPDYVPGCKRILSSSDWYPTLARPDVTVHAAGVSEVTETGVVLSNGRSVELDVLVWCTGFVVDEPLGQMDVLGVGGKSLKQTWGNRPRAHLGVTMPGFPNLFLLLGPNTGLGHNSVVVMIEAQVGYVVRAIRYGLSRGESAALDVKPEAEAAFVAEMNGKQGDKVWASGCRSWYLNDSGENFSIWPGTTLSYLARMARFDAENYTLS